MKLRNQLFVLSLFTLSLPWAGYEYIREMEATLRNGQAQSLLTTTKTIAHVLAHENSQLFRQKELIRSNHKNNLYAFQFNSKIKLDGYSDDWGHRPKDFRPFDNQLPMTNSGDNPGIGNNQVSMIAASQQSYLYLFIAVKDKHLVYHNPARQLIGGDRLQLQLSSTSGLVRKYIIQTSAPGDIRAQYLVNENSLNPRLKTQSRIQGQWQDTADGYNLELRIPIAWLTATINFSIIDIDEPNGDDILGWFGTADINNKAPHGLLIQTSNELAQLLSKFKQENARLRLADRQGWLLARSGEPRKTVEKDNQQAPNETVLSIANQIYHYIINLSENARPAIFDRQGQLTGPLLEQKNLLSGNTSWYKPEKSNRAIVSAAYPVMIDNEIAGIVVADQNSDAILTLTNYALNRLISVSSIAILLSAFGLLGYATYLSIRIRRLNRATEEIISDDGKVATQFQASSNADELGELSRSFANMHKRLREYTLYLQSLASKLSHELRTPLAIVQSSLDNLSCHSLADDQQRYFSRAREGSERLANILSAMSEASRVEQSIQAIDNEIFNLSAVTQSSMEAYKDIYPQCSFSINCRPHDCKVKGSAELIVQMLDKLIDNAVGFSPTDSEIRVSVEQIKHHAVLTISNTGPLLPDNMQSQLFDSMVSIRNKKDDKPHLGLGLHIVKLIIDAHSGSIFAHNREDRSGVEFIIQLPVI